MRGCLPRRPFVDAPSISCRGAGQELDPQLLEIAREAGGEQSLPLVGRDEARDLLLRPIEPKASPRRV